MTQSHAMALAAALASAAATALIVWRIRSGKSYDAHNPAAVTRTGDPFSFWLSLLPPAAVAILCGLGAINLLF